VQMAKKKNESEQTHPGAIDPFPQEGEAGPEIQVNPASLDLVDQSIDLCIVQLLEEWVVRTTWPRIQSHYSHLPTEQLNLAAEKCLQKVHVR
jgi:hypothetical protein